MSTKRTTLAALLIATAITCFFWQESGLSGQPSNPGRKMTGNQDGKKPPGNDPTISSIRAPRQTYAKGRILNSRELDSRFALTKVEALKLRSGLDAAATDLMEMKGLNAQVESYDGKQLELNVPALKMADDELESRMLNSMSAAIGAGKAIDIWQDPDGRATVLAQVGWELVHAGAHYDFALTRAENNPANNGSIGYATFDVSWQYGDLTDSGGQRTKVPKQIYRGFTFADADNIGLGWNAMSKAPVGYFRIEPILGITSRPKSSPLVIDDQSTGDVEVLNARHPGSYDKLEIPSD